MLNVLKYCTSCKQTWEILQKNQASQKFNKNTELLKYRYYKNLPSFGKPKAYCPSCAINLVESTELENN